MDIWNAVLWAGGIILGSWIILLIIFLLYYWFSQKIVERRYEHDRRGTSERERTVEAIRKPFLPEGRSNLSNGNDSVLERNHSGYQGPETPGPPEAETKTASTPTSLDFRESWGHSWLR